MEPAAIGEAIRWACLTELRALKPGNVHRFGDGHAMTVADFEASAEVIADVFAKPGLTVGERILQSVLATQAAVGCNTNLGIVLLCAPLAEAAQEGHGPGLKQALKRVLEGLTLADAQSAFEAIRAAEPAGLGSSERHDVHQPARADLRAAMAEASDRDLIARQYATDFADVFGFGLPRLRALLERWHDEAWAAASAYMGFLARNPDSHIARKHGAVTAEALRRRAQPLDRELLAAARPEPMTDRLLALDRALKGEGLNPGTSADLTVASLFALRLDRN